MTFIVAKRSAIQFAAAVVLLLKRSLMNSLSVSTATTALTDPPPAGVLGPSLSSRSVGIGFPLGSASSDGMILGTTPGGYVDSSGTECSAIPLAPAVPLTT